MTSRESPPAASAPQACPLCRGRVSALHVLPHAIAWQCEAGDCRLRFAAPQVSGADLRAAYRSLYYPGAVRAAAPACVSTPGEIHRELIRHLNGVLGSLSQARLLDYGCGHGALAGIAQQLGMRVVGVEQDPHARGSASRHWQMPIFDDLAQLRRAEPDAMFDAIVLWQVIEHLREPWTDLARLRELLTPTGCLVVATPNSNCLKARLQRARWENFANPTHFYYFADVSLSRLARQCGLEVVDRLRLPVAYPHHGVARRCAQRWLRSLRLDGDLLFVMRARDSSAVRRPNQARLCSGR